MPDHVALLAHIVSRTRQDIEFLVSQGEISRADGNVILNKLPTASDISVRELSDSTRRLGLPQATSVPSMPVVNRTPSVPPPQPPVPAARRTQQAKTLWAYNEDGSVSTGYFHGNHRFLHAHRPSRNRTIFHSASETSSRLSKRPMRIGGQVAITGAKVSSRRIMLRRSHHLRRHPTLRPTIAPSLHRLDRRNTRAIIILATPRLHPPNRVTLALRRHNSTAPQCRTSSTPSRWLLRHLGNRWLYKNSHSRSRAASVVVDWGTCWPLALLAEWASALVRPSAQASSTPSSKFWDYSAQLRIPAFAI